MNFITSLLCFAVSSGVLALVFAADMSVKIKMEENGIVPDIIDVAPNDIVQVTYPSGVKVELGNELTPTQVKDQPTLQWNADDDALYTVLMADPDAPPQIKEVRHWLVVNVPGNRISEGKSVIDYVGSGPLLGTGLHRYTFLIFKQPNVIETDVHIPTTQRQGRTQTKVRELIQEYNLGIPVAGNFYRAQYDDYVPIIHAGFSGSAPKANIFLKLNKSSL